MNKTLRNLAKRIMCAMLISCMILGEFPADVFATESQIKNSADVEDLALEVYGEDKITVSGSATEDGTDDIEVMEEEATSEQPETLKDTGVGNEDAYDDELKNGCHSRQKNEHGRTYCQG